ncbi:hypothetical protein RhiirA4_491279 [Rhizophagus irregularis]|uniref:Uncharacterized protein n=1 Tax=Rhizophagus irregularis TaxID=588596 RepID=A0A2I1HWA8_9GLOM|nr:hypothetical protein RhiirA4_491279 [Rhizophagus irregularis]
MDSSEWIVLPPIFLSGNSGWWRLSKVCDIGLGVVQALLFAEVQGEVVLSFASGFV